MKFKCTRKDQTRCIWSTEAGWMRQVSAAAAHCGKERTTRNKPRSAAAPPVPVAAVATKRAKSRHSCSPGAAATSKHSHRRAALGRAVLASLPVRWQLQPWIPRGCVA